MSWLVRPSILACLTLGLAQSASAAPPFPPTDAGRRAAAFFAAYATESDLQMRRYLQENVAPEALKRRSLEDRLEVAREMHAEHGALEVLAFTDTAPDHVDLEVRTAHGGRLSMGLLFEPEPPHRLLGMRVMDLPDGPSASASLASGPPITDEQMVEELRQYLEGQTRTDAFSGAVLLAKGDRVLFREAYGLASRETKARNTTDTRFNLGSIDKAFTRIAVEQLAAAGRLSLSDTLDVWVPEYPVEKGRKITLQQLIDHRGGTGDFFGPRFDATDHEQLVALRDWLPLFADLPLAFEPGTRQEYSNAGYLLLGLVVEKASGQSYYDHVRDRVFTPAGMTSTGALGVTEDVPNRALGYTRRLGGGLHENRKALPARGSSAGGGYSTLDDLRRFADAMRSGRLGSARAGLGVAGGAPGINAALEMRGEYTTVVLANLDPPAALRITSKVRELVRRAAGPARAGNVDHGPDSTTLPPDGVDVPMARSGHLPAVEVRVNGQGPYVFEIDTGAAGTARIDASLAKALGLVPVGEILAGDPSGQNPRRVPLVHVESLEVGGARFTGLTAAVREEGERRGSGKVDGILGFALFAECLLTLDYPGGRVRLSRGALPPADGREVLDFRSARGAPSVTLQVAGHRMEADVDAGSPGGVILPEAEAPKLPMAGPLEVVGRGRTASNTFEIKAAPLLGDVVIGALTLSRPQLEFQPVFPMASIGARVLRDLVVTFDLANHRLRLTRPASPPAPRPRETAGSGRG